MQARLRAPARDDIDGVIAYYLHEAGGVAATDFVDALERALGDLCQHPRIGSLRFAFELDIPELRSWRVPGFPHLVFYVTDGRSIDVWRVLHVRRDVPAILQPEDEDGAEA